jgi:hypothetical protein
LAGNELDKEFIEQQQRRLLDRKAELERMQREAQEVARERSTRRRIPGMRASTYSSGKWTPHSASNLARSWKT